VAYFDSAYVAKFYLDEPESVSIRELASSLGQVHSSLHGRVEVAVAFHRKWREGALRETAFREVAAQFDQDCGEGVWQWLPLTRALLESAATAIARLPRNVYLRSGDLLHLSCAREHGFREIYSNDQRLLATAKYFGLRGVSV
jgi:predicted nucleic acid-binding protein